MSNNDFPSEVIKEKVPDIEIDIAKLKLTIIKTITLASGEIEKEKY